MTKQIAIIDPYIQTPALRCFNELVALTRLPLSYHQPAQQGVEDLLGSRDQHRAYVVLGSASHLHEKLPWHRQLADFLIQELNASKPVLGCCFGHQLLCAAFGAEVEDLHADGHKELGLRKVTVNTDFWNFRSGESFNLAVTHRQVVKTLTPDLLAVGSGLPNDLVIHRRLPFLGVQPHPETSRHYFTHELPDVNSADKLQAKDDGDELILRFFKHFNLI